MSNSNLSRHTSYNNRFRTSSSSGDDNNNNDTTTTQVDPRLHTLSENVDLFGHSLLFGQLSPQGPDAGLGDSGAESSGHALQRVSSSGDPRSPGDLSSPGYLPVGGPAVVPDVLPSDAAGSRQSVGDASRPTAPGKPRRLSRQMSADGRRQNFAASKTVSGEGRPVVTSVDSGCDDVFVDVGGEAGFHQHDSYLFPSKRTAEATFSTSSTASILPNPYNRVNHRIHSCIWCCSCLYFVFFCCLPAIHFMEQSDVEFSRDNQKRARSLGRASTFLFFTGSLVTLSMFALLFFLAIFFTVY